MKKKDKEIYFSIRSYYFSILLTNYLKLGFSINKPYKHRFHINLFSCQIEISK